MIIVPHISKKKRKYNILRKSFDKRKKLYEEALEKAITIIAQIKSHHKKDAKLRIAYISGRVKTIHSIIRKAIKKNISVRKVFIEIEDISNTAGIK